MKIEYEYMDIDIPCDIKKFVENRDGILILMTNLDQEKEKYIRNTLDKYNLKLNTHYFFVNEYNQKDFLSEIFPLLYARVFKNWYVPQVQITLTTRCTLKCKDCSNGCNHWNNMDKSNDLTFEQVKNSVDILFSKAIFVDKINLLGGEPLLCQDILQRIYPYLKEKYYDRYREIGLYTNGSIIPSKKTLEVLKNNDVFVYIGDYLHAAPHISYGFGGLLYNLRKYKIRYFIYHEKERWFDYKMFEVDNDEVHTELIVEKCLYGYPYLRCPEIIENKLYICSMGHATMRSLGMDTSDVKYLDLNTVDDYEYAVKYCGGLDENWCFEACAHCNGPETKIIAAIQEERE